MDKDDGVIVQGPVTVLGFSAAVFVLDGHMVRKTGRKSATNFLQISKRAVRVSMKVRGK